MPMRIFVHCVPAGAFGGQKTALNPLGTELGTPAGTVALFTTERLASSSYYSLIGLFSWLLVLFSFICL